ncbi:MAG TPA: 2-oxoglutarate dehydrogenase complex dihydrolipoyllysine-residue succinyltransferase [Rhodopirellula baltica]|uniref:Dihydrolipoyllysine-residue succinyltransferase component of 2-oxoglutarate dehydrogenase complex n=1 Tax=Rhodopirellula baltica (strain DSM 10527 / NCIMB 13988 / SH1) TaxID=243090 RepID=Q7ULX6_RHOBA|nr:2-oxoglutarate dehydrogenase complex dihydrolipoyllysine-residue succinyltransferase [Rhodopirellula baltica]CAD76141.1 dihydrolipoamide succinyltransferase component of 2-oxoglutarate dehydrogenase complex [Rhodopirellula baltica SH 1]HBE63886.1 2-oxoglutarate dehydrogenase complex dihydrolipoyllysine-residue succinyltransferase [Rhodopirellula baltica]
MSDIIPVEVPTVGESISEVQIGNWLKQEGDWVKSGEDLVEIETEKASVQIPAPASGYLQSITKQSDEFAEVGQQIASIQVAEQPAGGDGGSSNGGSAPAAGNTASAPAPTASAPAPSSPAKSGGGFVMPAAQRLLDEHKLDASQVPATGPGGRLLKEDVLAYIRNGSSRPAPAAPPAAPAAPVAPTQQMSSPETASLMTSGGYRSEEVKPMSMLRRTIASRLVQAQQTAALLTTFNEINMAPVMAIRSKYKDAFAKKHGVKLGFMSFFAKATVEALRRYPAVNAEIRGDSMVYRNYQDIGIAIGGGKGLVVPVLRNVERMSFAEVEGSIAEYARLAGENRLQPSDLMGGTFTISNGGIYGSLLSTPIVNPPQSGILGLHSIQERPVAEDGQVVIRPMMYVALTYDHRIVDGREAVGFLVAIKETIEDPARLFLEV